MKFELNPKEIKAANKFIKAKCKDKAYLGAIGGRFSYIFCVTSIGVSVSIHDSVTNTEKNITDYDNW